MYKCQYCGIELSEKVLLIHEPQCVDNPKNKIIKEVKKSEIKYDSKETTKKKVK